MRSIALDVHRAFCEVAIRGGKGPLGRADQDPPGRARAVRQSLGADDQVALETTGRRLRSSHPRAPRRARRGRQHEKAARDRRGQGEDRQGRRRDAVELLDAGFLAAVFCPDEWTRALRRRLARRSQLVRSRTRAKNELHAVLPRNLKGARPSAMCRQAGRRWLGALELPADERETVEGCLRQVDFLDQEVGVIERELAEAALGSPEIRRLMTVPGVSLISAATFVAAVGDIARFGPEKLVSYLGLDPKVRQSGETPAPPRADLKAGLLRGSPHALRGGLDRGQVPGPLRAFYERVRARRGAQIALVATARKLCVLFWHLLTREEDYAFGRPTLTRRKLRALELKVGAEAGAGESPGARAHETRRRTGAEREFAEQAEIAYRRLVTDWQQAQKKGAGATRGRASSKSRRSGKQRGRHQPQNLRFSSSSPAPTGTLASSGQRIQRKLDLHPSEKLE